MKVLVLNTGSSSIKFQLFEMPGSEVLAKGVAEQIAEPKGLLTYENGEGKMKFEMTIQDHRSGLNEILKILSGKEYGVIAETAEIKAIGHRVVHGGEHFTAPTVIDDKVLQELKEISYLAPLHNPAGITGIEVAKSTFPNAVQVAIFDTAFHQTIPDFAYRFSVPGHLYKDHGLRVYGFHGTSHGYVLKEAAKYLQLPTDHFNAITIHLGNGCSMAAIKDGKCIDTTMGLTPLGGLMMGSRSGDIDPSLILFLGKNLGRSLSEIDNMLNKESGLKGLTGTNDLREVLGKMEKEDPDATLALEIYTYRIKKYIGAYVAAIGKVDAIIFTAGVGENSPFIREKACAGLDFFGVDIDKERNAMKSQGIAEIQSKESKVKLLVVPTNEELEIAQQTYDNYNI